MGNGVRDKGQGKVMDFTWREPWQRHGFEWRRAQPDYDLK